MVARMVFCWVFLTLSGASALFAQDKGSAASKDLEAVKAQLKTQEDRIDKLSQEVMKLAEALKQKGIAVPAAAGSAPTPLPLASGTAAVPATAGVDSPTAADPANTRTHTVAKGETLSQIAKQFGVTVDEIEQLNKIEDAKKLQAGQTIKIPPPVNAGASSSSPASAP
ncbi:MAG TPA: LysM peptidoglycan-binding domain-containing protein [Chthoniobacterales bacterium]